MRLWSYQLISVLPDKMLLSQWRELIAIKRKIDKCGSPNHALVNKVLDYSINDFKVYTRKVYDEMIDNRGFNVKKELLNEILDWECDKFKYNDETFENWKNRTKALLYDGWHNDRYIKQCFYNIQEKYDCGIVNEDDYVNISTHVFIFNLK